MNENWQSSKCAASTRVHTYCQNQEVARLYVFQFGWRAQGEPSNSHDPCYLWLMQLTSN